MQPLDPLVSLAFSIRANPGVYALLLGSGISRSAGIPTGWEVVLDLISKIAAAEGVDPGETPDRWYAERYGKEAGYSDLLDQLCRTPTERQQLLKKYFEPNDEEREQGLKLPTPAHHAIAELMQAGLIRVVITTNFDRLLEQALEQRGIIPTVIGSPDQAKGMIPLTHQTCCIIKIHGDYLDTRILNTETELESYDPSIATLIDRVFDEFGLIISGWSATWDAALRSSIERAPNRRYACFWSTTGDLTNEAKQVVASRKGEVIKTASADSFFEGLLTRVQGLDEFDRPHPLSHQAAVGAAKRYLADDKQRIRLHDLYRSALRDAKSIWTGPGFSSAGPRPTSELLAQRIKAYDAGGSTLLALIVTIARWSRGEHDDLLADGLTEIGRERTTFESRLTAWSNLEPYPATLMLYSAGMASLIANRPELLSRLVLASTPTINHRDMVAVGHLVPVRLADNEHLVTLWGGKRKLLAMSFWLHDTLRPHFIDLVPDDDDYMLLFDTFEYFLGLAYFGTGQRSSSTWVPVGPWALDGRETQELIIAGMRDKDVRYGGRAFAEACAAFIKKGSSLQDAIAVVEESGRRAGHG